MTKVNFVKSARKEYNDSFTGEIIKKGESYYWWAFRFQPRKISKTPPKPSQLTQSEFLQNIYGIQEEIENMVADSTIIDQLNTVKGKIESLRDEVEEKLNNMPDNLQNSQTAELLQSRIDSLQEWVNNLDDVDSNIDEELNKDGKEGRYKDIFEEIQSKSYEGE